MLKFPSRTINADKQLISHIITMMEDGYKIILLDEEYDLISHFKVIPPQDRAVKSILLLDIYITYSFVFDNIDKISNNYLEYTKSEMKELLASYFRNQIASRFEKAKCYLLQKYPNSSASNKNSYSLQVSNIYQIAEQDFVFRVNRLLEIYTAKKNNGGTQVLFNCFRNEITSISTSC